MDPRRFDLLARRVAHQGNRRALIRAGIAAIATLWFTGDNRQAAGQETCPEGCPEDQVCGIVGCYRPCETHRDCRSKQKDDPCVSKTCLDGACHVAIVDCLPGFECCQGECCPKRCDFDAECAVVDPCRWGSCGVDGYCAFTEIDPCHICTTSEECLNAGQNTVCCDGACQRPCPEGTIMGKGCECQASGSAVLDGLVVRDDASGSTPDR